MITLTNMLADYTPSLGPTAQRFQPEDLERHITAALRSLSRYRPVVRRATVLLQPRVGAYPAPADLVRVISHAWGADHTVQPWHSHYLGPRPRVLTHHDGEQMWIEFTPAPTATQVHKWGTQCPYRYAARHQLTEDGGTVPEDDRHLVRLRAQVEALRELAVAGVTDTIQMHRGMGASLPSNGTPAALAQQWRDIYLQEVQHGR